MDSNRKWTLRDLEGLSGVIAGTPERLADIFQEWIATGVDGFNLAYVTTPGSFSDFIEGVVPLAPFDADRIQGRNASRKTLRRRLCAAAPSPVRLRRPGLDSQSH
jgi:hypothetical protein